MDLSGNLLTRVVSPGQPSGNGQQYSARTAVNEASNPIAGLLTRLAAAADRGSPLSVGRRARVLVRRVPSGFSVERGAGR
jgi:hypothetical protein